jgi:hypothetical protein
MEDGALEPGIRLIAGTILPYDTATREQNGRMRENKPGSGCSLHLPVAIESW